MLDVNSLALISDIMKRAGKKETKRIISICLFLPQLPRRKRGVKRCEGQFGRSTFFTPSLRLAHFVRRNPAVKKA
jgi:hypothetical protein